MSYFDPKALIGEIERKTKLINACKTPTEALELTKGLRAYMQGYTQGSVNQIERHWHVDQYIVECEDRPDSYCYVRAESESMAIAKADEVCSFASLSVRNAMARQLRSDRGETFTNDEFDTQIALGWRHC